MATVILPGQGTFSADGPPATTDQIGGSGLNVQLDAGSHSVEARYIPGDFDSSTGTTGVTVAKADCTATLSGGGASTVGENVVFIAGVDSSSTSGIARDGTLTMRLGDGTVLREISPFGPTAFVGVDNIPVGSQEIYFDFSGGPNHNPCSSNRVTHTAYARVDAVDDSYTIPPQELNQFGYHRFAVLDNDAVGDDAVITTVSFAQHGNVAYGPHHVAYDPAGMFSGTDTFTYTITNGAGHSDTATVTVTVLDPIVAVDDAATTAHDEAVTVDVIANDTAPDPNSYVVIAGEPAHGTVVVNDDNTVTYTPDPGYAGTDTFDYQVFDNIRPAASATVTVTVDADPPPPTSPSSSTTTTTTTTTQPSPGEPPRNGAPVVGADSYTVISGQTLVVGTPGLLANDSDPDGDPLTATLAGEAEHGMLVVNPDGSFAYTPDAGFVGTDSFSYTASDGESQALGFAGQSRLDPAAVSAPMTVTITVSPAAASPAPAQPVPTGTLPATR